MMGQARVDEDGVLEPTLLEPSAAPFEGFRGYIDFVTKRGVVGWATELVDGECKGVSVGIFVGGVLIAVGPANIFRESVKEAGIGDGKSGFDIKLTEDVLDLIYKEGGEISVEVIGQKRFVIGGHQFPVPTKDGLNIDKDVLDYLRPILFPDISKMISALEALDPSEKFVSAERREAQPGLFGGDTRGLLTRNRRDAKFSFPNYLEFTKARYKLGAVFNTEDLVEDRIGFLDWYITVYAGVREGLRPPLSKELIDFLNEPVIFPGKKNSVSRALLWKIVENPMLVRQVELDNDSWYDNTLYWWCIHRSFHSRLEDCLVPERFAARLKSSRSEMNYSDFPISIFLERYYNESSQYHTLNLSDVASRKAFTYAVIAYSMVRPDFLRFIPEVSLEKAFALKGDGQTDFGEFLEEISQNDASRKLTKDRFRRIIRKAGYDPVSKVFLTITSDSHRWHSAVFDPVPQAAQVDVQIIGPFNKASGLGQAARLVAQLVEHAGFDGNTVDFGLDNPAKEGFSSEISLSQYKQAKVNIIHLNGESIPLAFAYAPDVFSKAYNIGFFYWELNTPADCHALSLDLLDEIWVATDYGVNIYKPFTSKPVVNVGMSFEELPAIDADVAKRLLIDRFYFNENSFVFFAAFDSFSFVQRKNPIGVIKAFQKAFPSTADVRLVIKTQNRSRVLDPVQVRIWAWVDSVIESDNRITLLDETLSYKDLLALKKGCDCYVSLHRSEGWGFGMLEAMNLKVPVICTGYSGNMEFCSESTAWLVDYDEVQLGPDDYIFVKQGQKWAEPNLEDAARQFKLVYSDPAERTKRVDAAYRHVQENFSTARISMRFRTRLKEIMQNLEEVKAGSET